MPMRLPHISRWTTLMVCCLLLAPLLIACGSSGSSGSTSTPSSTSTSPSTASPSTAMTTLTGNGFTISYPQTWRVSRSGTHLVTFEDSTGMMKLSVTIIPDPNGSISADSLVDTGVKAATAALKNTQTESVPATTTIGGQTWVQKSVSGTQRLNNQDTMLQVVVLANVHPGNTPLSKGYTIVYRTTKAMFNQANTTYFQPMLQSFQFK
jgi:hypothetical protein